MMRGSIDEMSVATCLQQITRPNYAHGHSLVHMDETEKIHAVWHGTLFGLCPVCIVHSTTSAPCGRIITLIVLYNWPSVGQ